MCRVSGSYNISDDWIKESILLQAHGGPDFQKWVKVNDKVNFGHCLLSIIGYKEQPILNDRYAMTFAGEWFNFKDHYPNSISDTESLLEHFTKNGLSAINDVNGQFSIALFDKQEQKIHLWADRFNQRNIYYYHEGETFAFASTPAALYALKDKWELDREALQSYWLLGSTMGENGLFKGIKKLCASEHLTYNVLTNSVKVERSWEPKYISPLPE